MSYALSLSPNESAGTIENYLSHLRQLPKLSAEEEQDLARKYVNDNDLESARNLVLSNLRFVVHIARGYLGYGLPLQDLVQEGSIGLMKAVKRYDPELGVRLVSFAVHWIRAEIHEFIIQNWRIVKVATTKAQRKLFFNLRKMKGRINWLKHDEAIAVAEELGVEVSTVYEMENRLASQDVAFEPQENDEDFKELTAPSLYLSNSNDDPAVSVANQEWGDYSKQILNGALLQLDDRSRDILASRWLNDEKATLGELAERHNISAERVRQIENGAIKRLRCAIQGH